MESTTISKIDLVRTYYHIPVAPENMPKTMVATPFGSFEFLRMSFEMTNAAQTFNRFIDHFIRGLPEVYAYIDDLLIASSTMDEHLQHPRHLFKRLREHSISINVEKMWIWEEILAVPWSHDNSPRHHISPHGSPCCPRLYASRLTEKATTIPWTIIIDDSSQIVWQYYNRRRTLCGNAQTFHLLAAAIQAFKNAKTALGRKTMLVRRKSDAPLGIMVDSSNVAVGAVFATVSKGHIGATFVLPKKTEPNANEV